jgi:hypothetical protein
MTDTEKLEHIKGQLPLDIVVAFQGWQRRNPDEDYQYDEIGEFIARLSRGELLDLFQSITNISKVVLLQ